MNINRTHPGNQVNSIKIIIKLDLYLCLVFPGIKANVGNLCVFFTPGDNVFI